MFWMAVGAGGTLYLTRKVGRARAAARDAATPAAIGRGFTSLGDSVRRFTEDVRAGMTEREDQLRQALGLDEADDELAGRAVGGRAGAPLGALPGSSRSEQHNETWRR
jgi:hypothetical protein